MRFRLVYQGPLPSNGSPAAKHRIRLALSPQVEAYMRLHPQIGGRWEAAPGHFPWVGSQHQRCGYHLVPMILADGNLSCSLDILFLRPEAPGRVVRTGGDLDNRIKTLFDGLSIPQEGPCRGIDPPDVDKQLVYCLLQDDRTIHDFRVTSDRLLQSRVDKDKEDHVLVIINVTAEFTDLGRAKGSQLWAFGLFPSSE